MQITWSTTHGAWFLQANVEAGRGAAVCTGMACHGESLQVMLVLIFLTTSIVTIMCALNSFREDKEEQITPLCPQMVVKESELAFTMALGSQVEETMDITDQEGKTRCKVLVDYPDPFRPGTSGVAATVRLVNEFGDILGTVVARNVAMQGQGLALCRGSHEIFGFVEPEGHPPKRYHVRHRTGVHMLTLTGDFGEMDIGVFNPARVMVGSVKKVGDECHGRILQHVDSGLVLCSLLATYIHRRLATTAAAPARALPQVPVFEGGEGEDAGLDEEDVQPRIVQISTDVSPQQVRGVLEAQALPRSNSDPAVGLARTLEECFLFQEPPAMPGS